MLLNLYLQIRAPVVFAFEFVFSSVRLHVFVFVFVCLCSRVSLFIFVFLGVVLGVSVRVNKKFQGERIPSVTSAGRVRCKLCSSRTVPHAHRAMERRCQDEMWKHKLAGHAVDPDAFLQEGVLRFDHHAAGQRTILVSHLLIANVHKLLW